MKQLTLIFHTDSQKDLVDQLRSLKQVRGFTFSHIEGRGVEAESDAFLSARDKVVGYTPRLRADLLLDDGDVAAVIDTLREALPNAQSRVFYWVVPVDSSGHL